MKNHMLIAFWYMCLSLFLTSCLQEKAAVVTASSDSWFEGVASAKNKGGLNPSILVSWNSSSRSVTGYRIYTLTYDPTTKTNKQTALSDVGSDETSFLHSQDITSGAVYTYMVRALDDNGKEDTNTKQVSTVAFNGIGSVAITGTTTAKVTLENSLGSFDEIRIYAQPERTGGTKVKVATVAGGTSEVNITGLQSGVKYKFFANAYMSYLGTEDGNEYSIQQQTRSESFGSGLAAETTADYAYRGMISVQAFGDSTNAPAIPSVRMVRLTWLPFSGANSGTTYRVVRADSSNTVDTTATTACSATTNTSCVVTCVNVGFGTQTCEDWLVAAAPKTYNYVVTLVKTDSSETWAEELPATLASDFYTKVSIPPANMVLVHRDAANYDMCQMLGTEVIPRKHQRCAYTGIAAKPYNKGPGKPELTNLDSGFYDFGYNLFVDRYQTGCNWTRVSATCGSDGCIGITSMTTAAVAPSNTLGSDGNVFFAVNGGYGYNCYYKKSGSWVNVGDPGSNLTSTELYNATTIDPGTDHKTPVMVGTNQAGAFNICNSHSTEYGNKRLMRRREYVQASAFATLPGEPNTVTDKVEASYLRQGYFDTTALVGGQQAGFRRCASPTESRKLTIPTTLSQLLASTNYRSQIEVGVVPVLNKMSKPYFIGTIATSNCVSRFGMQDPYGVEKMDSGNPIFADTLFRSNAITVDPATFTPVDSDYDTGVVRDWYNSALTYQFNGTIGPAVGTAAAYYYDYSLGATEAATFQSFVLPMGLPLYPPVTTVPIYSPYRSTASLVYNGTLGASVYNGGENANSRVVYRNSNLSTISVTKYIMSTGQYNRFSYLIHPDQVSSRFGTWCALEAE